MSFCESYALPPGSMWDLIVLEREVWSMDLDGDGDEIFIPGWNSIRVVVRVGEVIANRLSRLCAVGSDG
jgi:hypothetical protein